MGARPVGFALDLALPKDIPVECVREFYQGVSEVLAVYGVTIEGGDIDANDRFETAAMCWGVVPADGMIRRQGARIGDVVAVTTPIGLRLGQRLAAPSGSSGGTVRARAGRVGRVQPDAARSVPPDPGDGSDAARRDHLGHGSDRRPHRVPAHHPPTQRARRAHRRVGNPGPGGLDECAAVLGVPPQLLSLEYGYDTPRMHGYTVSPSSWEKVNAIFTRHGWPLYRIGTVTADVRLGWRGLNGTVRDLPRLWYDAYVDVDIVERWMSEVVRGLGGA